MANREKDGRVVFIGNIPYTVSEEQICDIFSRVGQVVNFRLVYDKETGKPKGFGFLEYTDVDAAASAVRNLNDHEVGGRTLRVDYSNDNGGGKTRGGGGGGADQQGQQQQQQQAGPMAGVFGAAAAPPPPAGALPPMPPGVELPPGLKAMDAISGTLSSVPPLQLLDVLSQMKNLASTNPAQVTAILSSAPQLGYAIFQALLMMGLVDTNILSSLLSSTGQQQAPPPQQQQQQPPPAHQAPSVQPPQGMPPMPMGMPPGYPPNFTPGFPPPQPPGSAFAPQPPHFQPPPQPPQQSFTPVQQQQAYQPPPPPQQQPTPQQGGGGGDPQQAAMIQQLLQMTREQVMGLDAGMREQVNMVRRQFGAPVF